MKIYDLLGGVDAPDIRMEESGGRPLYIGFFERHGDDNCIGWIFKLTWGTSIPLRIEKLQGKWGDRATLGWA